jgi:TPR repeat protein
LTIAAWAGLGLVLTACASAPTSSATPGEAEGWVRAGRAYLARKADDPATRIANERAANALFQQAADAGNLDGADELCVSYQGGRAGIQDTVDNLQLARHWCGIAAAAGNQDAQLRYDEATKLLRAKQMWVTYYLGIPWDDRTFHTDDPLIWLGCVAVAHERYCDQ